MKRKIILSSFMSVAMILSFCGLSRAQATVPAGRQPSSGYKDLQVASQSKVYPLGGLKVRFALSPQWSVSSDSVATILASKFMPKAFQEIRVHLVPAGQEIKTIADLQKEWDAPASGIAVEYQKFSSYMVDLAQNTSVGGTPAGSFLLTPKKVPVEPYYRQLRLLVCKKQGRTFMIIFQIDSKRNNFLAEVAAMLSSFDVS